MLSKSKLSLVDDVGDLFIGNNKIYRGIHSQYKSRVINILDCGLIDKLVNEGLFPETIISSQDIAGYELVLEHRKIDYVTYPFEWSPEMLRDAGLTVLKVNEICNRYGYELKDAHPFNLIFDRNKCLFVDFGSFKEKTTANDGCYCAEEFLRSYYYPLYFYSTGAKYLFATSLLKAGGMIPHIDYLLFKNPLLRLLPEKRVERFISYYFYYKKIYSVKDSDLRKKLPTVLYKIVTFMKRHDLLLFSGYASHLLQNKLLKLKLHSATQWSNYHQESGMLSASGAIKLTDRMKTVLAFVSKYKPCSVLELGGNHGVLSRKIAEINEVKTVVCSDYDFQAIDGLYKILKLEKQNKILPVVLDMVLPSMRYPIEQPEERLKAEMVIVLAVTHHLMLTQGIKLDVIIDRLYEYSKRYLIVEFMPMGLYGGQSKTCQPVPDWYTKQYFKRSLDNKFHILCEMNLERNRILFMAEKRL